MKISGSHTEQINSASINILRLKEEGVITGVTEALSNEGKHVINIIHGTPSSLMGSVYKSITFLWEADDESPEYLQAQERKQQELKQKKLAEEFHLQELEKEVEISVLKQRIENAEYEKTKISIFNLIFTLLFALNAIGFTVLGFITLIDQNDIEGLYMILGAVFCLCLGFYYGKKLVIEWKENKENMEQDRQNLDALKEELYAKITEFNEFKNGRID